jgi:iron complex transport system permease protein
MRKQYSLLISLLIIVLVLLTFLHLNGGFNSWILMNLNEFNTNSTESIILKEIHLPRTIMVLIAGSALSIAGLLMQTYFNNPLAGPSILGISSGSNLFVAITLMSSGIFSSNLSIISAAILGAIFFSFIILGFSLKVKSTTSLLIVGVMLSAFTSSIVQLIQADSTLDALRSFTIWNFGSVQQVQLDQIPMILFFFFIGFFSLIFLIKPLNLLVIGENQAEFLGLQPRKIRWILILITSIFTGLVTAFCGPISFVGLAVPNLVKLIFKTTNHKTLIIGTLIVGSLFLLICDLITYSLEDLISIPLNSITSLFGAPIIIWIIIRRKWND